MGAAEQPELGARATLAGSLSGSAGASGVSVEAPLGGVAASAESFAVARSAPEPGAQPAASRAQKTHPPHAQR
jgi:hypothetical protein